MPALSIPHTIGGARLAKPHNDNFDAIQAWANGSIGQDNIAADSVGTGELIDGAVTLLKMGDASVGTAELVAHSVTADKLATAGFTFGYLSSISALNINPALNTWVDISGATLGTITPTFNCSLLTNYQILIHPTTAPAGATLYSVSITGTDNISVLDGVAAEAYPSVYGEFSTALAGIVNLVANTPYTLKMRIKQETTQRNARVRVQGYSLIIPR